jgi:hypothetical protein
MSLYGGNQEQPSSSSPFFLSQQHHITQPCLNSKAKTIDFLFQLLNTTAEETEPERFRLLCWKQNLLILYRRLWSK